MERQHRAHLLGAHGVELSEDGKTVLIAFEIAGEDGAPSEKFAVTFPTQQAKWFRSLGHDIVLLAEKAGVQLGGIMIHQPVTYDIGSSEQLPDRVVIKFDRDTPGEITYAFFNVDGLKFAAAIERDIIERGKTKPRIILPPLGGGSRGFRS